MDTLVKRAYDNWDQVIEYDGKSLLSFRQSKRANSSRNELQMVTNNYPTASNNQLQVSHLPPLPSEQTTLSSGLPVAGKSI